MFSDDLRALTNKAVKKQESAISESFIFFVKERAVRAANAGHLSYRIFLSSLPWSEEEIRTSFPVLQLEGLKISIDRSTIYDDQNDDELIVNWIHNE